MRMRPSSLRQPTASLQVRRFILLGESEAEGVFTLFAILYFLVGVGIMGLGVIGEYVGRIYQEVRRRPRFVIREIYERLDIQKAGTGD